GGQRIGALEQWARERYPQMGQVAYAWSGQVQEPADYVGFIGVSPQHEKVYLATGDSGQGMTTGGVAALILSDLILGRENPWTGLYDPHRKMHRSLGEYVKENVEATRHWVELITARDVGSVDEIAPGEGALMRHGGKPVAVFRGEDGEVQACSAVCPHAGCTVHWNSYERCWDCPCHGSQFSPAGEVLCGPAAAPLAAVDLEEERSADHEEHRPQPGL
ncbi:MAG TPA: FAD-dependent oxidoreductase, partial [Caulobacteraceae bacterium]|nr:FAD-dependent oxidoreductase [Caulobacteraceae bacterium]